MATFGLSARRRTSIYIIAVFTLVIMVTTSVLAAAQSARMEVDALQIRDEQGNVWSLEGPATLALQSSGPPGVSAVESLSVRDGLGNAWGLEGEAPIVPRVVPNGPVGSVLSGDVELPGFEVPPGEVWRFDPYVSTTVTVDDNVIVRGRLEMKPASPDVIHTLRFVGIDEREVVGGGMQILDSDVGLWVPMGGQVDLQGSERAGWNRTGTDPTWRSGDEIRVTPTATGSYEDFAAFAPGDSVPSVTGPDGSVHHAEVFNVTRNVRIEGGGVHSPEILDDNGRAHVTFLHCSMPQTVRNVELRYLGPRTTHERDGTDGVMGRYPLHFHHCGDGSRGSVVDSVVVRDSGNRAFVPHESNGITFTDTIAFDVYESAYWWDEHNESHDITYDHAAALLVRDWPVGRGYGLEAFQLGEGTGNVIRDSVAVGMLGRSLNAGGFHWPSKANGNDNLWVFQDNVAHNNRTFGISTWQNDPNDHVVEDFVSYRNGRGISHGAYINRYTYRNGLSFDEDVMIHALGATTFEDLHIGGNLRLSRHQLGSDATSVFRNLTIHGQIIVEERGNSGNFRFESDSPRTDLRPEDFTVISRTSHITVVNSDGGSFTVE